MAIELVNVRQLAQQNLSTANTATLDNARDLLAVAQQVKLPTAIAPLNTAIDVVNFGADAADTVTKFNDDILAEVKTSSLPGFETNVINVLTLAKGITIPSNQDAGGLFNKIKNTFINSREQLLSKFTNVSEQIDNVTDEMSKLTVTLRDRNVMLEGLYTHNMEEYDRLEMYIDQGEAIISEKQAEVAELKATLVADDLQLAQVINDKASFINRLEKRVDSLKRIQLVAIQTAPFIRLIQDNNLLLIEKFGDLTTLTIPSWKKQFMLSLSLNDQRKGVAVANAIDDATNALMKMNSDLLKQNTVDVYQASQRSVVDIDTLQYVQNNLIETLSSVATITKEGQVARATAQKEIEAMKHKYLQLATQ